MGIFVAFSGILRVSGAFGTFLKRKASGARRSTYKQFIVQLTHAKFQIDTRLNSLKGTDRQIDYSWRFILWIGEYDPILRYTAIFQMGACTRPGPRLGMYFILMIIICVRFSIKELTTSSSLHRWERCAGSSDTLVSLFSAPQRSFLLAGRSSNSTQCITFLFKTGRYPSIITGEGGKRESFEH